MIHSLAGGEIRELKVADFAKVEIVDDVPQKGLKFWYISDINGLNAGDKVQVPLGSANALVLGVVERVDRYVNSQVSPVPMNRAKKIFRKIGW